LSATLDGLREAYHSGLETGDFEYARYVLGLHCFHAFHCGRELGWMEQALAAAADVYVRDNQVRTFSSNRLYHQVVLNLRGQADDPTRLVGPRYDETQMLPQHMEANNLLAVFRLYLNRAFLEYLFGQPASALESVTLAAQYVQAAVGMFEATLLCFYDSLIRLAVAAGAASEARASHLEKVSTNQKQLHRWAQVAPMNFLHKFHLVEAERARIEGRAAEAREQYDAAIALAQQHGYLNDEALAYELAGQFYLARGQSRLADYYLRDARAAYARWGAHAKVTDLEARYPHLAATPNAVSVRAHTLDIGSLLKASQAIAAETHLDRLLARLMRVVIENAGAQTGSLLLPHNGQWTIQAEAAVGDDAMRVLHAHPLADAPVPLSLVTYVLRTHENVVLDDAARLGDFTDDPQIVARQRRSILCMPLLHQGQVIGLLYLENNLTPGAFTPDRLEMLHALAGQAAIALENARQAEALRQAEAKYRRIFEQALEGIFQTTPDGRLLTANPALAQMAGCTSPETLLAHVTSITEAYVDSQRRVELLHLLEQHGEARNFEAEMYRKDGSTMWVSMNVRRVQTTEGTMYFEGFIQDITERRRAEAEQRKQEALRQAHDELERRVRQRTAALAKANADLRAEVAERQRAEAALRENLSLVQAIIEGTTDAIFVKDLQGRYVMINAAGARFLGKPVEEILGKDDTVLFSPDTAEAIIAGDRHVLRSGTTQTYEDVGTSMGITRTYLSTKGVYRDQQGTVIGLFGIARDITERKQTDERIKASLHEKEVLLKEIHHRVKNNLQIISSLLSLQARYLKVPQAQDALDDSKNRVKSIALLHELLYQSKDIARIDFAQYIKSIILQLFHAYDVDVDRVTFEINADNRVLEIDAAIPFGLIINELVSNSLKHAFPGSRRGKISIELSCDGGGICKMIVGDNGIGFPKDVNLRTMNSLGVKLVIMLIQQLSGTIVLDQTAGARFTFTFGHPHIKER